MKASQLLFAAGLVAFAQAWGTDVSTVYTTVVTTAYETYCPSPTTFIHQNVTYTATTATTLTITNCPCTITTHKPPPYTTTKTIYPPPAGNTTVVPPPVFSTTTKTPKPSKPTYHNTTVVEHTPQPPKTTEHPPHPNGTVTLKPPKPSHHSNLTSTVVVIVTPPAETTIGHITPVTDLPTKTPVGPSTTRPITVPGSGAGALTASAGAAVLAGIFALLI